MKSEKPGARGAGRATERAETRTDAPGTFPEPERGCRPGGRHRDRRSGVFAEVQREMRDPGADLAGGRGSQKPGPGSNPRLETLDDPCGGRHRRGMRRDRRRAREGTPWARTDKDRRPGDREDIRKRAWAGRSSKRPPRRQQTHVNAPARPEREPPPCPCGRGSSQERHLLDHP